MVSLSALWLAGCSVFGDRSSYEAPDYKVVESLGQESEVRVYAPRLAAEATVESKDPDTGRNAAFRLLFDYISGENQATESISMTVPVETKAGEKIAMTVPVETVKASEAMSMRFFFPAQYNAQNAPQPLDPRVKIVELPETTVAVRTYSGSTGEQRLAKEQAALLSELEGTGWQPSGDPTAMFYDPPWTLWFARRNEAVIPVKEM
jgi:hypothetical protein